MKNFIKFCEATYYHGTIGDYIDSIESEQKLLSPSKRNTKGKGLGNKYENDFVYITPSVDIADQYARNLEYNMWVAKKPAEEFGAIVEVELGDDVKLIDLQEPLTDDQLVIVNRTLPSYKPLKSGDSLSRWAWRTNYPMDFAKLIKDLGFQGYIEHKNAIAILDEVPIKAVHRSKAAAISAIQI